MTIFDSQELPLECAKCGTKTPQTVGWLKTNTQFTCACGAVVRIDVAQRDQVLRDLAPIEQQVTDLKRRFKWIS